MVNLGKIEVHKVVKVDKQEIRTVLENQLRPSGITDKSNPEYGLQKINPTSMSVKDAICYKCQQKGHMAKYCRNAKVDRYDYQPYVKPKFETNKPVKQQLALGGNEQNAENVEVVNKGVGCTFEIIRSPIACIPLMVNGVQTHGCDDHGSSVTFVDKVVLKNGELANIKPWNRGFIGMVNGTVFKPLGELENVKIELGISETIMSVAVLETNMVPVLLGDDFRKLSKLKITCFEGGRCYQRKMDNGDFECVVKDSFGNNCCKIEEDPVNRYTGKRGLQGVEDYRQFCAENYIDLGNALDNKSKPSGKLGPVMSEFLRQQQMAGTSKAVTQQSMAMIKHGTDNAPVGLAGFCWDPKIKKFI